MGSEESAWFVRKSTERGVPGRAVSPEEVVDGAAMGFERVRSSGGGILFLLTPRDAAGG